MYQQFEEIIKTMDVSNYDYNNDLAEILKNVNRRAQGKQFSLQEHAKALILAMLTSQRVWADIQRKMNEVCEVLHNFDVEYLKSAEPKDLVNELKKIKCGNRQIAKQMFVLKYDIEQLEKIAIDHGSIDTYYNAMNENALVDELANGRIYKLRLLGKPLVSEYLKNVGVDIIKPDVHVCRILGRLGFSEHSPATMKEAFEICDNLSKQYHMSKVEVDSILWRFCAKGQFELCTANPKCTKCLVTNCRVKNSL